MSGGPLAMAQRSAEDNWMRDSEAETGHRGTDSAGERTKELARRGGVELEGLGGVPIAAQRGYRG